MKRESDNTIAILGLNRQFAKEHRIINEIEAFSPKYTIDGYGSDSVQSLKYFNTVKRPMSLLRRSVILLGGLFPRFRIWFENKFYRNYAEHIKVRGYRFIVSHNIDDALIGLATGIPFLFHSHEYLPRQFDGSLLFRFTESRYRDKALCSILPSAVLTIVEGEAVAREYALNYGIPLDRFIVMPSMPRYRDNIKKESKVDSSINLIHHGLLVPERGIELLMDIAVTLGSGYRLALMGPGPIDYVQSLKVRAKKAGNIDIIEPVPYDQIVETLLDYDLGLIIFGSPHFHHTYMTVPNKFWECLQARVPVLVSPSSAMAEYVKESGCGIVSDTASIESYVAAVRSLSLHDIAALKTRCEEKAWIHSRDSWLNTYSESVEKAIDAEYERRRVGIEMKHIHSICSLSQL